MGLISGLTINIYFYDILKNKKEVLIITILTIFTVILILQSIDDYFI